MCYIGCPVKCFANLRGGAIVHNKIIVDLLNHGNCFHNKNSKSVYQNIFTYDRDCFNIFKKAVLFNFFLSRIFL